MATLTKIDGQYRLRFTLYLPDGSTRDRSRRVHKKGLGNELKAMADILESRTRRGEYTGKDIDFWKREGIISSADAKALQIRSEGDKTIRQAAEEYRKTWSEISPQERKAREGRLQRIVEILGPDTPIAQITYLHGEHVKSALIGAEARLHPNSEKTKPLKAVTINKHLQDLKRLFRVQLALRAIDHYPFAILENVKARPAEKISHTVLNFEQIDKVIAAAERQDKLKRPPLGGHLTLYLLMLFGTGIRRSEAIAARLEEIDWKNRTLTLKETKNGHRRIVWLGKRLFAILLPRKNETGPILPAFHKDNISRCIIRHFARCGIKMRLHDTRHTYTTRLLDTGITRRHAKGRTGHTDDRMLDHYDHPEGPTELFEDNFDFMKNDD